MHPHRHTTHHHRSVRVAARVVPLVARPVHQHQPPSETDETAERTTKAVAVTAMEDRNDMLVAALDAYDNGLCVVRAKVDGTKAPLGQWKQYQQHRPTRDEVASWFANGHAGMGVICGAVSGDLEMFELEARFVQRHTTKGFLKAMRAAGLELLLKRMVNGLCIISPSDGRHFIYRVDGPADGNTKLARDVDSNTLIETRGEAGFVVLPPSHGSVHPSGNGWRIHSGSFATIPTITIAERDALFTVARSYDEAPAPPPVKPVEPGRRAPQQSWRHGAAIGDSWVDAVVDHLTGTWSMLALLEHYGWVYCYEDRHGRTLIRRPGKDEGVSGSINESGRFHPFSTSVPFAVGGKPSPTYDQLDVIAAYEHGGDRQTAARSIAETTGILADWKREQTPHAEQPRGSVNTDTGELVPDDDLWTMRPFLQHVLQASRSRLVSPYATLGAIMARVAAFTPPSTCLPPFVGSTAPLSLYVALRGRSGAGKSSPEGVARDLLPGNPPGCVGPLSLGSGEGLVEAFMELVEETDGNGKKRKVKRQIYSGALFSLDEGQLLGEIASRRGSTVLPVLRTAWSGGDPGQANASIETRRSLKPGSYAVGLISLWQDKAAALLLADVDGGTPQRFVWLPADDPGATIDRPPWPGKLEWERPPGIAIDKVHQPHPMDVDPAIEMEITVARVANLTNQIEESPLDAHRRLNKLKVAGVLAVLDGRHDITIDDWAIAEKIMGLSDQVRGWIEAEARRRAATVDVMAGERAVLRDAMVEQSQAARALHSAARAVWRACSRRETPVGRSEITRAIASRDRQHVTIDDAIGEAERLEWVKMYAGEGWVTGAAKPA